MRIKLGLFNLEVFDIISRLTYRDTFFVCTQLAFDISSVQLLVFIGTHMNTSHFKLKDTIFKIATPAEEVIREGNEPFWRGQFHLAPPFLYPFCRTPQLPSFCGHIPFPTGPAFNFIYVFTSPHHDQTQRPLYRFTLHLSLQLSPTLLVYITYVRFLHKWILESACP